MPPHRSDAEREIAEQGSRVLPAPSQLPFSPTPRRARAALRSVRRSIIALGFAVSWALPGASPAQQVPATSEQIELASLMSHFSASGTVRADFNETRQISLLTDPIETRGILYFSPPNRLARETTWPSQSRIAVHGVQVAFQDEMGTRRLNLSSSELARHLVGTLMLLLRGDLSELQARHSITFTSDGRRWQLGLEPRSSAVRGIIEGVGISGVGWTLESMKTTETNGDTTVVAFSRVTTQLSLSVEETEHIFSLDFPAITDSSSSLAPRLAPQSPAKP